MRTLALVTFTSFMAFAALPSHASQADRDSDMTRFETAEAAPFSGQLVIRGEEVRDQAFEYDSVEPAPYSGQIVHRGEVTSENFG